MTETEALEILREMPRALIPARLQRLQDALALSEFERDLVRLCFAMETEPRSLRAVAQLSGESMAGGMPVGVAHAVLGRIDWPATSPAGALRRWQVLHAVASSPRVHEQLRLAAAVTDGLLGLRTMDAALEDILTPLDGEDVPPESLVAEIAAALAAVNPLSPLIVAQWRDEQHTAAAVANALGLRPYVLNVERLRTSRASAFELQRIIERQSVFDPAAIIVVMPADTADTRSITTFLATLAAHVFVIGDVPPDCTRPVHRCRQERGELSAVEQWRRALGPVATARLNGSVERVAEHFLLTPRGIAAAGATVREAIESAADEKLAEQLLWNAGSRAAWPQPGVLARVIQPVASLEALVVPSALSADLHAIVRQVRHGSTVYDRWGFASHNGRGRGLAALFAGPSGCGKSFAAEAIAHELALPLVVADFSQLQSKWVGESAKHVARLFDELDRGGAVLLIDEADGLLGQRQVDGPDRHSHADLAYFLQRLESFRGLAILTTNLKGAIDAAFLRRYRFVIDFPLPGFAERRRIWERVFPQAAPQSDLDLDALARLPLTGGAIRNVALNAAFAAADAAEPIRPAHLLAALHAEYRKLERSPAEICASLDS